MGSLFTKRDLPPAGSTYVPVVAAPTPTAPTVPDTSVVETPVTDSEKASAIIARKRSLPETILTSFRGVLSQNDFVPQRKSLLGE